jgi:spermidine synthase
MFANAPKASAIRLFGIAAMSLFVELALIRWMGANVLYLGYFANFVLLACFLGLGLGFLLTKRDFDLFEWSPAVLALLLGVTLASRTEIPMPDFSEVVYFHMDKVSDRSNVAVAFTLGAIFLGTVGLFASFGQAIGRRFGDFDPIPAYTLDIFGSLAGIVSFTLLSFMGAPSYVWFGIAGAGYIAIQWSKGDRARRLAVLGAIGVTALAWASHRDTRASEVRWSPYQFLKVYSYDNGIRAITANRVPHQHMVPSDHDKAAYTMPMDIARNHRGLPESLLVIGAGSGSDLAFALRAGVKSIHAVEIDPVIAEFGETYNVDKPYSDPRVRRTITDGRRVLEHDPDTYDMVIFALPDSLALLSNQSSIRLESFLFTKESFESARERLNDGGVLALYNFYRSPYVVERIARTLEEVFGHRPVIVNDEESGITVIAIGEELVGSSEPVVQDDAPIPTDDWPFLYLRDRSFPSLYIYLVLSIWAASLLLVFLARGRESWPAGRWPYFFMGAAFLLLETKSIVQFSILFGATWLVNSLVFAGVLLAVLFANWLVHYFKPSRLWPWYVLLAVSLLLGWLVPIGELSVLESSAMRYILAVLLLFSPIFFANMIFSQTFAQSEKSELAFGWNILGMMLGGTIEYTSMVMGYQNLAILVAVFYALAFVTTARALRSGETYD